MNTKYKQLLDSTFAKAVEKLTEEQMKNEIVLRQLKSKVFYSLESRYCETFKCTQIEKFTNEKCGHKGQAECHEIKKFMKDAGMYIEGMYEIPEIRDVNPGHLVRSGQTTAYDVNFGRSVGAGAVTLLVNGVSGVTVVGIDGNEVSYMPSKEAIQQRYVDLNDISLYEAMGVCFGRKPEPFKPELVEVKIKGTTKKIKRIY